ncbi:MAG: diguanylate cyclase domain-containing protein [Natronincolaceae bacterium]|nr:GGDEF domain-containing protein [Bacillota bacterium]
MGFPKNDRMLLSIINKAIDAIDDGKMEALILDATTRIDRKPTLSMIVDVYDKKTFGIISLIIVILLFSVISSIRLNNKFRIQNKINDMLSQISNEYVYKYFVKSDHLDLSKKYTQLFRTQEQLDKVRSILRDTLLSNNLDGNMPIIKLPVVDGVTRTFKGVSLNIHDKKKKSDLIIGKLIDISEQIAEKKELIMKTKMDGMTSLYNSATVKELINEGIKDRDKHQIDALIIIDCDKFKYINDTYGHLTGDQVLRNVSMGLRLTFRQNDILGRVGGDEFCVYMRNVSSADLVRSKCQQLNEIIQEINRGFYISVSSGIAFLREESTYRELFAKADKALYEAKTKGGGQCVVHSERQRMFHKGNLIWAGANYEKKR